MSGGVDSSVTAYLLKEQGYHVIGLFMKNWDETDQNVFCPSAADFEDVVRVCEQLDIPYYSVNFVKEYWDSVFVHFLNDLKAGYTPNPDILCNREIKFNVLLDKALELGGDYLATGHYARNLSNGPACQLAKGLDPGKDQSYFLYTMGQRALNKVLFPVGELHKPEVRKIARQLNLYTSEKKDSTGICFIGEKNFREFLPNFLGYQKGSFVTLDGKVMGEHLGLAYYTLGQRRGLGIGGAGDAWFVVEKDVNTNSVIVAQGPLHPALYCDHLTANELSWVAGEPPALPFKCQAKIRYRQPDQECTIREIKDGVAFVEFARPQRAATPRQSIVFYDGDICLGGGMIVQPGPSYYKMGKELPEILGS